MAKNPFKMTKISEVKPYDRNPRIIPQAAVDAVAKSIQTFGFRQPIVVDGQGVILAGHTRYRAALQLGLEEVPVVWQADIDEIRARGYRIADNKTAELSAWDRDALDAEVRELTDGLGDDIGAIGLAEWELERILASLRAVGDEGEPSGLSPTDKVPHIGVPPEGASTPQPEIKDRVLLIYYSLSELQELAAALGLEQKSVQTRRSYTVNELIAAQKANHGGDA